MSDQADVIRGEHAKQLLENPLFIEAFSAIEAEIIGRWRDTPEDASKVRETLWTQLLLLSRVKLQIVSMVESGKFANHTLAQRAKSMISGRPLGI